MLAFGSTNVKGVLAAPGFLESDVVRLVASAGWVTKSILVILLIFSILSWAIILYKAVQFRRAAGANRGFLTLFDKAGDLQQIRRTAQRYAEGPAAVIFLDAMDWLDRWAADLVSGEGPERTAFRKGLERRVRASIEQEAALLEERLPFLATTANVSPFIGLFGTVLGIIDAFHQVSRVGNASIAAVAPGVAEALVATAAGLLAAIPAVVAYNHFLGRARALINQVQAFAPDLLERLEEYAPKVPVG